MDTHQRRSPRPARKGISLPFSDHCEPLIQNRGELVAFLAELRVRVQAARCSYVELRPLSLLNKTQHEFQTSEQFYYHSIDLRVGAGEVFRRFHRDCIQRKIRRAEREGIEACEGTGPEALRMFYDLVIQTRRRQGLPP
jgi:lipid II:glycine glycyltransferase (peptidoglycan interpeptide bridge formation enzyme)